MCIGLPRWHSGRRNHLPTQTQGEGLLSCLGTGLASAAVASYQKVPAGPSQHTFTLSLISLFFSSLSPKINFVYLCVTGEHMSLHVFCESNCSLVGEIYLPNHPFPPICPHLLNSLIMFQSHILLVPISSPSLHGPG